MITTQLHHKVIFFAIAILSVLLTILPVIIGVAASAGQSSFSLVVAQVH